jgi:hypothetical protein
MENSSRHLLQAIASALAYSQRQNQDNFPVVELVSESRTQEYEA